MGKVIGIAKYKLIKNLVNTTNMTREDIERELGVSHTTTSHIRCSENYEDYLRKYTVRGRRQAEEEKSFWGKVKRFIGIE